MTQRIVIFAVMVVMTISITQARQLLGDNSNRLSDVEVQTKVDAMMVLANRVYDVLEHRNNTQPKYGRKTKSQT